MGPASIVLQVPALRESPVIGGCCGAVATEVLVADVLGEVLGVRRVTVDEEAAEITVDYDPGLTCEEQVSAALAGIGMAPAKVSTREEWAS